MSAEKKFKAQVSLALDLDVIRLIDTESKELGIKPADAASRLVRAGYKALHGEEPKDV